MINNEILESRSAYRYPPDAVVAAMGSDARQGLTAAEARSRLQSYGRNELPSLPPIPI